MCSPFINWKLAKESVDSFQRLIYALPTMRFKETRELSQLAVSLALDPELLGKLQLLKEGIEGLEKKDSERGLDWNKYSDLGLVINPPDLWERREWEGSE